MTKVSEMMIAIGGDLLSQANSHEEMQAHLAMIKDAWNMSLLPDKKRSSKLKKFIKSQEPYAPDAESLMSLEWEYQRMMKQRKSLYPNIKSKIVTAEVVQKGTDDYVIRAYFKGENGNG